MMVVHNLRQIGTFSDVEFLFLWLNAVMEYDIWQLSIFISKLL